jgi:hypothetical protein
MWRRYLASVRESPARERQPTFTGGSKMKLRVAAASLLLVLAAAACTGENPVGSQVSPSPAAKEAGNWMGSDH